jgi:hypothetical protein
MLAPIQSPNAETPMQFQDGLLDIAGCVNQMVDPSGHFSQSIGR